MMKKRQADKQADSQAGIHRDKKANKKRKKENGGRASRDIKIKRKKIETPKMVTLEYPATTTTTTAGTTTTAAAAAAKTTNKKETHNPSPLSKVFGAKLSTILFLLLDLKMERLKIREGIRRYSVY